MKTLDSIQNPVELTKIAIFSAIFYKAKNNINDDSFNPVESLIYDELEEHYDKPIQSFDSNTRIKLMFINRIQSFNYKSAYVQLDGLGWNDWRFPDANKKFKNMNLLAWVYFYNYLRKYGIENNLINEFDHITVDEFEDQFELEYGK